MRIEVTKSKKKKTEEKAPEVDVLDLLIGLIEAETKIKEKAGIKVATSSEEMAVGKAIARKLDIIDDFESDFIMPLVTKEFDICDKKRLEYMMRVDNKLSEIIDDMGSLLFGALNLDEVKRNDNEDWDRK